MALDPIPSTAFDFIAQVERAYAGLKKAADTRLSGAASEEPGLGGKLLYTGGLDAASSALVVAGNVAGAASLAATANPAAQKQAIRDGVVDFLVTSLDEALRILKNEIRKRETVAVCVGAAPDTVECEMLERGGLPDLLAPDPEHKAACAKWRRQGAQSVEFDRVEESAVLVAWRVAAAPALWLPRLDSIALDCVEPGASAARRWLRLAPRYLGRLSQGVRLLRCDEALAARLLELVREQVDRGEIAVPVEIQISSRGESHLHLLSPPGSAAGNG